VPNKFYDNTRIEDYRRCPRLFYFRHIRHWRWGGKNVDFAFGLAWHDAMDVVWGLAHSVKSDDEIHKIACAKFIERWVEEGFKFPLLPEDTTFLKNKTPGVAAEMLLSYIKKRRPMIVQGTVKSIEAPFAVLIDPEDNTLYYIGRIDKKWENAEKQIIAIEHKTTGLYRKEGNFSIDWINLFSVSLFTSVYLRCELL